MVNRSYLKPSGIVKPSRNLFFIAVIIISVLSIGAFAPPAGSEPITLAPTKVSGLINTTETWTTANSPYIITDNLTIGSKGVVYIQPAVQVKLDNYRWLKVYGHIYSNGTKSQPIKITHNQTGFNDLWDSLYVYSSDNSFIHTNLSYCNTSITLIGTSSIPVERNILVNCTIDNVWVDGINLTYANNNYITNTSTNGGSIGLILKNSHSNDFEYNNISWAWDNFLYMSSSDDNYFFNNTFYGWGVLTVCNITGSSNNDFYYSRFIVEPGGDFSADYLIRIHQNSKFNLFDNVEFLSTDGRTADVLIENADNITFQNSLFKSTTDGPIIVKSSDILFSNSIIITDTTTSFESMALKNSAHVTLLNTIFYNTTLTYYDSTCTFTVAYFLTVNVYDLVSTNPVLGAQVSIKNQLAQVTGPFATDANGGTQPIALKYYTGRDIDGNKLDVNPGERTFFTPHNVTVSHIDYFTNYSEPEPQMTSDKQVSVNLKKIKIDYLKIQFGQGQSGDNASYRTYSMGSSYQLYSTAHNAQIGYVKDVSATWSVNIPSIATVSGSGTKTTFTTSSVNSGTVRVTAQTSLGTTYADLTVDAATVDYIRVQDSPTGTWVGNMQYAINETDTFYCVGYNDTIGNLGTVPADSWSNFNPNVASLTGSGSSVVFKASLTSYGDTRVEARYKGKINNTGKLTVLPPAIDYIIIRTGAGGTGSYVGSGNYNVNENDTFYCAGYNDLVGFVSDVPAAWQVGSTSVGSVTSPGTSTTFTAKAGGITKITATYKGLTNSTGNLVVKALSNNFDLTVSVNIVPGKILLKGTPLTITITVENIGSDTASNVVVHFIVNGVLESSNTIPSLAGAGKVDFNYPNSTAEPDTYEIEAVVDPGNTIKETDEGNNRANISAQILSLEDWTKSVVVTPSTITLTADEQRQFNATGIGRNDEELTVNAAWSVDGGGTIDPDTGVFEAGKVGVWTVTARVGAKVSGTAVVTVIPGALKDLEISPDKVLLKVEDSVQFTARGYDADGNEVDLAAYTLIWYANETIGIIDETGKFVAKASGFGSAGVQVQFDKRSIKDEVEIIVSRVILIEREYEVETRTGGKLRVKVGFLDNGNASITNLGEDELKKRIKDDGSLDRNFIHIGIFVEIEIPEGEEWEWLYIEIEYDPALLPEGFDEEDLELYYYDEDQEIWILAEGSGVDTERNVIFGNVTHLTIFAPMADNSGAAAEGTPEEDATDSGFGITPFVILSLIAVVFIVALAAGVIIIRKRRVPAGLKSVGGEEDSAKSDMVEDELVETEMKEEDEDEISVDLSRIDIITKKCPECKEPVSIEPSYDEKVHLECPECGKKGRLPNPYLKEIEKLREDEIAKREREKKKGERKREEKGKPVFEEIECRGCGEPIEVPFSDDDKIRVDCDSCGAHGKIKNPYLKPPKEDQEDDIPKGPKHPGRKKPKDKERPKDIDKKEEKPKEIAWDEDLDDVMDFDDI